MIPVCYRGSIDRAQFIHGVVLESQGNAHYRFQGKQNSQYVTVSLQEQHH